MNDLDRRAREAAIRHSATRSEVLDLANAEAVDWQGVCRFCGLTLTGSKAQLAAHRCDEYLGRPSGKSC